MSLQDDFFDLSDELQGSQKEALNRIWAALCESEQSEIDHAMETLDQKRTTKINLIQDYMVHMTYYRLDAMCASAQLTLNELDTLIKHLNVIIARMRKPFKPND
jgi:hypothetical protein